MFNSLPLEDSSRIFSVVFRMRPCFQFVSRIWIQYVHIFFLWCRMATRIAESLRHQLLPQGRSGAAKRSFCHCAEAIGHGEST